MGTLTPLATEGDPEGQRALRKTRTPGWLRQDTGRKVSHDYPEDQDPLDVDIYIPTSPPQDQPLWTWKENSRNDPPWTLSNSPSKQLKSPRLHLSKAAHIFKGSGSQERIPSSCSFPSIQKEQSSSCRSYSWTHQNLQPFRKLAPLESLCSLPQSSPPASCLTHSKSLPPRRLAPLKLPYPQPQPSSKGGVRTCQRPNKRPPHRLAPLEAHQRGLTKAPPTSSHSEVHRSLTPNLRCSPSPNDVNNKI